MSDRGFITIEELKEKLPGVIAKEKLPCDADLIMKEIENMVSLGAFSVKNNLKWVRIPEYKDFALIGQTFNGEIIFTYATFFDGPNVFLGQGPIL